MRSSAARRAEAVLRSALVLLALALAVAAPSACDRSESGAATATSLPPLELRNDTPNLLLTWVDERGATHTATEVGAVPKQGRGLVRVVVTAPLQGEGALFYVADLRTAGADGSYPVHTVTRAEWESLLDKRRQAFAAHEQPEPGTDRDAPPRSTPPLDDPRALSGLTAIVYGAAWCEPCHIAEAYLRRRGVTVVHKDIDEDSAARAEMVQKLERAGMRGAGIPVLDVGGVLVQGFSPPAVDRAIQKALAGTAL
ncbi:MAG: NrdH-redoxin [Polyangiaceae bacterium]|nr:NrdH-redoxin [Polyangiaceae bacterium]